MKPVAFAAFLLIQAASPESLPGQQAWWGMFEGCPPLAPCGMYYLQKPMTLLECGTWQQQAQRSPRVLRSGCTRFEPKHLTPYRPGEGL